jgi:hypothetical protein
VGTSSLPVGEYLPFLIGEDSGGGGGRKNSDVITFERFSCINFKKSFVFSLHRHPFVILCVFSLALALPVIINQICSRHKIDRLKCVLSINTITDESHSKQSITHLKRVGFVCVLSFLTSQAVCVQSRTSKALTDPLVYLTHTSAKRSVRTSGRVLVSSIERFI